MIMKIQGLNSRRLTLTVLLVLLLCCFDFEMCNARGSRHWRHGYNKHHSRKQNTKLPSRKLPPLPTRSPTPAVAPPPTKTPSSRLPTPVVAPPSTNTSSSPLPTPVVAPPPATTVSPPLPAPVVAPPLIKTPVYPEPIGDIPSTDPQKSGNIFNVLDYGAKGDGTCDDTEAFEAAWAEACKVQSSTMLIPSGYQFLVGPISFSGPYCQKNIVFQVDGTIVAPTNPNAWSGNNLFWWMDFTKLVGFTIQGKGTIDGGGSVWWKDAPNEEPWDDETQMIVPLNDTLLKSPPMPVSSEFNGKMPSMKPTAVRFYGSINVTVTGITIQNSPLCHLKFDNCIGVSVYQVTVSSPGDSPNTDGIHLQNSQNVLIHSSSLACGDDCISIQTGCSNVYIHNVNCGPGHGISIGSLGRFNTKACVSNVTVRDVNMQGTMTGVRIKTWQGGSGSVQGIMFSNIQMSEVQMPIVIDQYYCDKSTCKNATTAVAVSGVTYQNIKGTYTVKPVHLACSDDLPCTDITLNTIQLNPLQEVYRMFEPFCWQTFGELTTPILPPIGCLQIGKPLKNKVQTEVDVC